MIPLTPLEWLFVHAVMVLALLFPFLYFGALFYLIPTTQ